MQLEFWSGVLSHTEGLLLSLARAFVADPEVLCIDFPLDALGRYLADEAWRAIRDFVAQRGLERDPVLAPMELRRPKTCFVKGGDEAEGGDDTTWSQRAGCVLDLSGGRMTVLRAGAPAK